MDFFILPDSTENLQRFFNITDRLALILLLIVGTAVLVGAVYLIYFGKKVAKVKPKRRDPSEYEQTTGVITDVRKEVFGVSARSGEDTEAVQGGSEPCGDEELLKVRYDVRYEFKLYDGNVMYRGDFSIYQEDENIKEGKEISVMYNPKNPFANYTKYNSPIGRC